MRQSDAGEHGGRMVSASEIARVAYCERQIRFDAIRGAMPSTDQCAARRRGEIAHREFYEESRWLAARSASRGKCFIATLALGETPETLALRQFRDLFLRRSRLGRAAIAAYYRCSPPIANALAGRPRLLSAIGYLLLLVAMVAAIAVREWAPEDKRHGA